MTADKTWALRCITVMPDHLHLFITLGSRLTLAQSMARLKVRTKRLMKERSATWQNNFYDHQMRPEDSLEATLRYIWLNPYRKNLLSISSTWAWFYCCPEDWTWFEGSTDAGHPYPEWLI